ncbi:DEAD/DEAH box helicase [Halogeometricum borinquense]|uniref:DEAD/DEAH box helicase n=1 Tax=Halogeometricum borinquense TaxID=60847 RepID=A0A482T8R3_9EURY|nr:DEAD/DEAH box helicase [Halogeometricum borinquense]RYJ08309.1 DEAD/DEAH box helicase [Halogeometricum borinquense]
MKYADRFSNFDRFDQSGSDTDQISHLLESTLHNLQIFDANQDKDDLSRLVDAVKYTSKPKKRRPDLEPEDPESIDERTNDICRILDPVVDQGDDFIPVGFQKQSWETIEDQLNQSREDGNSRVSLITGSTGLGKTEGFLGPLLYDLTTGEQDTVIFVYPRRALLQDQFGRILRHLHHIREDSHFDADRFSQKPLSIGLWHGGIPHSKKEVHTSSSLSHPRNDIFSLTECWCKNEDGTNKPFFLNSDRQWYNLRCPSGHRFDNDEVVLHRKGIRHNTPNVILTTLESLELFSVKPNYEIINKADTIVFDEVHLLNGIYGAHASQIIRNIKHILETEEERQPQLVASSATLKSGSQFASKLFGVDDDFVQTVEPTKGEDYTVGKGDREHYYFILSSEEASLASTYIQQVMMLAHSQLQKDGTRHKILSFIDSISQVNQRHTQFVDADQNRELYKLHTAENRADLMPAEDWKHLSKETKYDFIDDSVNATKIYSDSKLSASQVINDDLIMSTGVLEVGMDIPDVKYITQYRTPWDLSSFVQRAGRAARKRNQDSHIMTFLSQRTGDTNLFYRADRFLDDDLVNSLNTKNHIINWIHEKYRDFYDVSKDALEKDTDNAEEVNEYFLEQFLNESLNIPRFKTFIDDPNEELNEVLSEASYSTLLNSDEISSIIAELEDKKETTQDEIKPLYKFIGIADDQIFFKDEPFEHLKSRFIEQGKNIVAELEKRVRELDQTQVDTKHVDRIFSEINSLLDAASDETNPQKTFNKLGAQLVRADGELSYLETELDAENVTLENTKLTSFKKSVDALNQLDEERVREISRRQKRIYYLQQVLNELDTYNSTPYPFASLWAVKALMRAAYYFDRYERFCSKDPDRVMYFVPPDYFSNAGQTFEVQHTGSNGDVEEESITSLLYKYAPYNNTYQENGRDMVVFQPDVKLVNEDESEYDYEFDFDTKTTTDYKDKLRLRQPTSINVDTIPDRSREQGQALAGYCPECYELFPKGVNECPAHQKRKTGKIHSTLITDPHLSNTEPDSENSCGDLEIVNANGNIAIDAVELQIRPFFYSSSKDKYLPKTDDKRDELVNCPDPRIGFSIETRSIRWDVKQLVNKIWDLDMQSQVSAFKPDCSDKIPYYTAAQFLLMVVADVSGSNPSQLFYGYMNDEDNSDNEESSGEVFVFERTEGGQGIVDLVPAMLEQNPSLIRDAIYRVGYDTAFEAESLWANQEFFEEIKSIVGNSGPISASNQSEISTLVEQSTDVPETISEKITEEIISDEQNFQQLVSDHNLTRNKARKIKHRLAQRVISGDLRLKDIDDDREAARKIENLLPSQLSSEVDSLLTVARLLVPTAVDGCTNNLHTANPVYTKDQEDMLSYTVLKQLRESAILVDDGEIVELFGHRLADPISVESDSP